MAAKVAGLQQLLGEELQDLYDAEKQLVKALPKIAKSCEDEELSGAFREHLEVTKGQVQRLERVFESLGMRAKSKPCKGMKGLVEEGQEMIEEQDDPGLLDAALIGAGRRVEHYEMAGYDSARAMAQQLGLRDAAQLLQETLREEVETDKRLQQIAKRLLKETGSRAQGMDEEQPQRKGKGGKQASGSRRAASSRTSSGSAKSRGGKSGGGRTSSRVLTDQNEIQRWAEERGAHPACVRGTGSSGDVGMIRLDFPGYSGADSLQEISWDDWFRAFEENNLALIVQDRLAGKGGASNFNKLVDRDSVEQPAKVKTAR